MDMSWHLWDKDISWRLVEMMVCSVLCWLILSILCWTIMLSLKLLVSEHLFKPLGKRPLADVWALDTAAKPYEWRKLEPEGEGPPPCM